MKVWEYTALRDGKEIEKGRCIALSLTAALDRCRGDWKYGSPPDDWRIVEAAISVEQLRQVIKAARNG